MFELVCPALNGPSPEGYFHICLRSPYHIPCPSPFPMPAPMGLCSPLVRHSCRRKQPFLAILGMRVRQGLHGRAGATHPSAFCRSVSHSRPWNGSVRPLYLKGCSLPSHTAGWPLDLDFPKIHYDRSSQKLEIISQTS